MRLSQYYCDLSVVSRSIIAEAETEFVLLENIFEKWRDLPFSHKSNHKKEKNMVSFMHEQNIICSQTKLDEVMDRSY